MLTGNHESFASSRPMSYLHFRSLLGHDIERDKEEVDDKHLNCLVMTAT